MTTADLSRHRLLVTVLTGIAVTLGVTVAVLTSDVMLGVIAGVAFFAVAIQMVRLWTGQTSSRRLPPEASAPATDPGTGTAAQPDETADLIDVSSRSQ